MNPPSLFSRKKHLALGLGLIFFTAVLANYFYWSDSSSSISADLDVIPKAIGTWRGIDKFFRDDIYPQLGADATLLRLYSRKDFPQPVWLYVGYTRNIREYNMGPHSPKVCYPGQGWKIVRETVVPLDFNHGPHRALQINEMIVKNGKQRRLVYYWYQSRDKVIASQFKQNYYAFWDKLLHNRSDLALVRISLPVDGREATKADVVKGFIRDLFPHLLKAIPQ